MTVSETAKGGKRIEVIKDGQYVVHGDIPLVRKVQVMSEYGEPLSWKTEGSLPVEEPYSLCRCGHSKDKPFCDLAHLGHFDGAETAETAPTAERQEVHGGVGIEIRQDYYLCMDAGFCRTKDTSIEEMAPNTADTQVRSLAIAMCERCPSGSLVYSMRKGEPDVEPDYPEEIAVVTEITSEGPIEGPLWVTGNIPVERADGQPFETRNRVTLCRCGQSKKMPLCDGTHRVLKVGLISNSG